MNTPYYLMAVSSLFATREIVDDEITLDHAVETHKETGVPYIISGDILTQLVAQKRKKK